MQFPLLLQGAVLLGGMQVLREAALATIRPVPNPVIGPLAKPPRYT
jgi:hypothetical protein